MRSLSESLISLAFTVCAATLGACTGRIDDSNLPPGSPPDNAAPFEAVGPTTYVPRVKNLMTGLAATDAEVNAVVADPTSLRGLVDQWMELPEFQGRMLDFFRNAFQQNQVTLASLVPSLGYKIVGNNLYSPRFERNIMDSFPMTVWELVKNGQPLSQAITTNTYMMTTAMMSFLSYSDDVNVDDNGTYLYRPFKRNAIAQFSIDPNEPATLAQTLDPTSPSYMKWHMPATFAGCTTAAPVVYTPATFNINMYPILFGFMLGSVQPYMPCVPSGDRINFGSQFADSDWNDWRMVTIQPTSATTPDTTPAFYDIIKLRAATTMTLHTKRIGFFGTLAFDSNWATNTSNEARVTANQALIVAIGRSINGENTLATFPVNATDADHAANPACAGCHNQLDPFKQYFRQSYSLTYHDQLDTTQLAQPAGFSIDGVTATGTGVGDIAATLASHPRLPLAWAQKLHFWATSTAALEDDPELVRIADVFAQNNLDFKTLARELFTSPLITLASSTKTTQTNGVILSIARRDQFCASLSNRVGLHDVCGMTSAQPSALQTTVASRALLLPVDTYYRSYALPSLPTNPDLFFRDSVEAVCRLVADQLIDVASGTSRYNSAMPDLAITDLVATVMGIVPSDPRSAPATAILKDNFTAALASSNDPKNALKSTFALACISPPSVLSGL